MAHPSIIKAAQKDLQGIVEVDDLGRVLTDSGEPYCIGDEDDITADQDLDALRARISLEGGWGTDWDDECNLVVVPKFGYSERSDIGDDEDDICDDEDDIADPEDGRMMADTACACGEWYLDGDEDDDCLPTCSQCGSTRMWPKVSE